MGKGGVGGKNLGSLPGKRTWQRTCSALVGWGGEVCCKSIGSLPQESRVLKTRSCKCLYLFLNSVTLKSCLNTYYI